MFKIGRNDPCPCGSGRKYKKCCSPKFDAPSPQPAMSSALSPEPGSKWLSNVDEHTDMGLVMGAHWPVKRAWVPEPEVWAVTGVGIAGVARESPKGEWAHAGFGLELLDRGIKSAFGKGDSTLAETEEFLVGMRDNAGPFQPGDAEAVAALVGACRAYADSFGGFPPNTQPFFGMLPRLTKPRTLDDLSGRWGLHPSALVEIARAHAHITNIENGAETAILTSAEFALADRAAALDALKALHPELDLTAEGTRTEFDYTRPSKPGQRAPMSRIEGRRVQGKVIVDGDRLTVISGALTMMARELRTVLGALTPRPRLEAVRWFSPTLDRGWSWNAAEEPLAMHGTAFDAG